MHRNCGPGFGGWPPNTPVLSAVVPPQKPTSVPVASVPFIQYMNDAGPEIRLEMQRAVLAGTDEDYVTTAPFEAIAKLAGHMGAWVRSRLVREAQRLRRVPETMQVRVRMMIDTQPEPLELSFDWERDWLAQASEGRLSRFSPQAMVAVGDKMHEWVLDQLLRRQRTTGTLPQAIGITVHCAARP